MSGDPIPFPVLGNDNNASIHYDPLVVASPPQLPSTPIAHFPSVPNTHPSASCIDVSRNYIAYAVKDGLVRVIDRRTANRTLLRGHSIRVMDCTFFGVDPHGLFNVDLNPATAAASPSTGGSIARSDVLGTVGGRGDAVSVLVWRLYDEVDPSSSVVSDASEATAPNAILKAEKLLEIQFPPACRLVWHPFNPNRFALLHWGNPEEESSSSEQIGIIASAGATAIETTKLITRTHDTDGHALCACKFLTEKSDGNNEGPTSVSEAGAPFVEGASVLALSSLMGQTNDLCWCRSGIAGGGSSSNNWALTAHDDGRVRLWDMDRRITLPSSPENAGNTSFDTAHLLHELAIEPTNEAVTRVIFIGTINDSLPFSSETNTNGDTSQGKTILTPPFLTGTNSNRTVTLWSPFASASNSANILAPTPTRRFCIHDNANALGPFRMTLCSAAPTPAPMVPPSVFVLLASEEDKGRLHALHVSLSALHQSSAVATGFDFVTPFDTVQPIYGWSVHSYPTSSILNEGGNADIIAGSSGSNLNEVNLFCIQSRSVQVLKLVPSMLKEPLSGSAGDNEGLEPAIKIVASESMVGNNARNSIAHVEKRTEEEEQPQENAEAGPDIKDVDILSSDVVTMNEIDFDEYDPDEGEENGGAPDPYEEEEDDDEEDDLNNSAPAASSVPPGFGGTLPSPQTSGFSNWLGAIGAAPMPLPSSSTAVESTVATSLPGLLSANQQQQQNQLLASIPGGKQPSVGSVDTLSSDNNVEKTGATNRQMLLSPMEFLSTPPPPPGITMPAGGNNIMKNSDGAKNAPSTAPNSVQLGDQFSSFNNPMENAVGALPPSSSTTEPISQQTQGQKGGKKMAATPKRTKSPKRSKSPMNKSTPSVPKKRPNDGKKTAGGAGKSSTSQRHTAPVPSMDGKIAILKREDKKEEVVARNAGGAVPDSPVLSSGTGVPSGAPASVLSSSVSNGTNNSIDIDETVRKALSTHFRKHESLLLAEIHRCVQEEIRESVLPQIVVGKTAASTAAAQSMEANVVQPLKDVIMKTSKDSVKVRAKEVAESVAAAVKGPVQEAFHQSMREIMVPAYEAATRQIFAQVASSIEASSAHHRSTLDEEIEKRKAEADESRHQILSLSSKVEEMALSIKDMSVEIKQLNTIISSEGFLSGKGNDDSAASGGQSGDEAAIDKFEAIRRDVLGHLSAGEYESAFARALSAQNGDVTIFACKNSDISAVMGIGGALGLSQPILLCLMQQLGAMLSTSSAEDLQVELMWLQDIAVSLDPTNESIRRHVGPVLQELITNISAKMAEGDAMLRRPLQMLLQVIRGIGGS